MGLTIEMTMHHDFENASAFFECIKSLTDGQYQTVELQLSDFWLL